MERNTITPDTQFIEQYVAKIGDYWKEQHYNTIPCPIELLPAFLDHTAKSMHLHTTAVFIIFPKHTSLNAF